MPKYTVNIRYRGSFRVNITAQDSAEAITKAREKALSLNPEEFTSAIGLIEHDVFVESSRKRKKMYQPVSKTGECDIPDGMFSFQVFRSSKACRAWLEEHGYDPKDFDILEYEEGDIEDPTFIG